MAYAVVQDMIDRYGEREVQNLAPALPRPVAAPFYDEEQLALTLTDVSAEIDSFLAKRWPVPLIAPVPPMIVRTACELAREALDAQGRAGVLAAGKRARQWLKDLAEGRATLGSGPEGDPEAVPEAEAGGAEVEAPDRVFDDAGLREFLR